MKLFRTRTTRLAASSPARRSAFRPGVEALEDRCLLNAGALDPTFGNGAGYVTTALSGGRDTAYSVLVQPDGKILATGIANQTSKPVGQAALIRYNADGSLDTSFGTGGEVLGPVGMSSPYHPKAALYPMLGTPNDGKIVLAEYTTTFSVARYNPNGSLDSSFGTNGIATANFGATLGSQGSEFAVIQPDGKLVGLGISTDGKTLELARFNADGSLDATFGQGGLVETAFQGGDYQGAGDGTLLLQPNGGLIVTTEAFGGNFGLAADHWDLFAYNADGSLNTSFGTGGFVRTPPNPTSGDGSPLGGSALYPTVGNANDGKIVMVGQGDNNGYVEWMVRRYNTNGTLDSTFGTNGTVYTKFPKNYGEAVGVAIQPDGKLVVSGYLVSSPLGEVVIRYNTDGSLDTTFGIKGIVTTATVAGSRGYLPALQSNGDIVVAGESAPTNNEDFTVTRYLGDPTTLAVTSFPSPDTAGVAETFTVTDKNPNGSTNTGYTGTVHFTSSDPHAALPADYTFTAADQGVHTFTATFDTAGVQFLAAADSPHGFFGAESGIAVLPAAASTLRVANFPPVANAGVAENFVVTALDAFGNQPTGYTGTVHFTSSDALAALPADYTFTAADQGVHTFTATLKTAGSKSLTATDTGSITGSESGITVKPAAASQFVLSAPASVTKGAAFSLTLTVEDAYGDVVTGYVGTVHFTSSDGTATLPVDCTFTAADAGVHTFTNKAILKKKGTQTLTVTDTLNSALTATDSITVA